jgi:hypothetical protein
MMYSSHSSELPPAISACIDLHDALQKAAFLLGRLRDAQTRLKCLMRCSPAGGNWDEQVMPYLTRVDTALTQQISGPCCGFIQLLFVGRMGYAVEQSFTQIRYAGRMNEFIALDVRRETGGVILGQLFNALVRYCGTCRTVGTPELMQGSYEMIIRDATEHDMVEQAVLEMETEPGVRQNLVLVMALTHRQGRQHDA